MSDTSPPAPPAGWDPDPEESSNLERRWDGWQWTSDTRPAPSTGPVHDVKCTTPHPGGFRWQGLPAELSDAIAEPLARHMGWLRCQPMALAHPRGVFADRSTSEDSSVVVCLCIGTRRDECSGAGSERRFECAISRLARKSFFGCSVSDVTRT